MGGHQDGPAGGRNFFHQMHDFLAGMRIQIARRLIREDEGGIVEKRPRNGHALLFSP